MAGPTVSSACRVEVEGQPLPTELDLASAEVESHLHLPDSFTLTFRDRTRTALTRSHLKIGAKVKIAVASEATTSPETLLEGEVTAVEAELYSGVSLTIVRGYDQSHRLFRGRVTEGYLNATYSNVATQVAKRHDLDPGTIDATTDSYDHIAQANESDWSFLSRLAAEIGYELTVADKKLNFRKPPSAATAPNAHDLSGNDPLALRPNKELRFIRTSVTAAEQVKEVEARAWNVHDKKVVKATAPTTTDSTKNGSTSAAVAKVFPGPSFVIPGLMFASEGQAEEVAKAAADRVAASHTEIEGEANGNPKLKAGAAIKLALLGDPFDGKYVLTTTRHTFDVHDGYVTRFTVTGRHERSLLSLTGGPSEPDSTISGVVPAVVDDVNDPEHLGRVRLKFPWMGDKYVSDWCPTVHVGAGATRGLWVLPEAEDQVLVAFEQGDPRRPYVLGGLYSEKDKPATGPEPLIDKTSKHVNNRLFTSRRGHQLLMVDSDKDASVVVQSSNKKLTIRLDEVKKKIVIDANGDLELHAGGDLKLSAKGEVSVKGRAITTEAQTAWKATGKPIQLN
jgi:phage protein D/phage baseplate assembly protein gpV